MKQHGFTLLELLVVVVIIGLLAAFVAPRYFSHIGKSQQEIAHAQIDSFDKALDQYRIDTGHYPTQEQGLASLNVQPAGEQQWHGPYLKKNVPLDPWGHAFLYQISSGVAHREYDLVSYGKDGQAGGTGENTDISTAN
jgi:general secretion pathway protein G